MADAKVFVRKSRKHGAILDYFFPGNQSTISSSSSSECQYVTIVPGASGVQNRVEGSDLGCKMDGKGPPWGAKWRKKGAIWKHGGGTGACALDTPRQAEPAARRVKLWDLTESC